MINIVEMVVIKISIPVLINMLRGLILLYTALNNPSIEWLCLDFYFA